MRLTVKSAELLKKYKPEARKLLRQYRAVNPKQLDSNDGTGQPPTFHVGEPMQTVKVPLQIREEGKEERTASVLVQISFEEEAQESTTPGNFMCFQLTDESYPNFLYTMRMSEEDFESFKLDQGILVDFDEFPERVTDLLKFCTSTGQAALGLVKGNSAKSTKFAVSLVAGSASTNLQIVETNEFRTIVHLRLDMRPCNLPVCLYRKYLTEELAKTRSERDRLRVALNQKISEARKAEEADTVHLSETVDREAELNLQIEHLKIDIAQWKTTYASSKKNLEAEIARAYAANSKYKELTAAQRARIEDIEALLSESVEQLGLFSHESVELRFELEAQYSENQLRATVCNVCLDCLDQIMQIVSKEDAKHADAIGKLEGGFDSVGEKYGLMKTVSLSLLRSFEQQARIELLESLLTGEKAERQIALDEIAVLKNELEELNKIIEPHLGGYRIPPAPALGLKWQNSSTTEPTEGRLLKNSELENALIKKTEFTEEEWTNFGVADLSDTDYIRVKIQSKSCYFKPAVWVEPEPHLAWLQEMLDSLSKARESVECTRLAFVAEKAQVSILKNELSEARLERESLNAQLQAAKGQNVKGAETDAKNKAELARQNTAIQQHEKLSTEQKTRIKELESLLSAEQAESQKQKQRALDELAALEIKLETEVSQNKEAGSNAHLEQEKLNAQLLAAKEEGNKKASNLNNLEAQILRLNTVISQYKDSNAEQQNSLQELSFELKQAEEAKQMATDESEGLRFELENLKIQFANLKKSIEPHLARLKEIRSR